MRMMIMINHDYFLRMIVITNGMDESNQSSLPEFLGTLCLKNIPKYNTVF